MRKHSSSRSNSNPIRIFVINDSEIFVAALGRFLSDEPDFQVVGWAVGLPEALTVAEDALPQIILIDPEPHDRVIGRAVRELRAKLPEVGIIVLTLHVDEKHRGLALAAGADAFVGKWAASADLLETIRDVAKRRPAGH